MTRFVFEIFDAFATPDGFDGETVLAGVRFDMGDLAVGDELWVPARSSGDRVLVRVAAFPLMSFTDWTPIDFVDTRPRCLFGSLTVASPDCRLLARWVGSVRSGDHIRRR